MRYPERVRNRSGDGWKIGFGLLTFFASAGVGVWLFMDDVDHDVHNYEGGTSAGNSVWMLGLVAVVSLVYVLWIVFRDVEEVIEYEVHEHRDDLRQLEKFEPRLFHWALAAMIIALVVAMIAG
jgi:hypothetical protein